MADFATVGLFDSSPDGRVVQANDAFVDILGMPKIDQRLRAVEHGLSAL